MDRHHGWYICIGRSLEKEAFIGGEKSFIDRKPNTKYYMTTEGKKAFDEHLNILEQIINSEK